MLKVQEYLLTHTLEELKEAHGVNYRIDGHKFSLNYDMIEAQDSDPIACQCRGTILAPIPFGKKFDENSVIGSTKVLCRTMDRFFNHGQEAAANVNFQANDTKFFDKPDGTMCALYFDDYKQEWHVATRSVPEANLPCDDFEDFTFRTLFEKALLDSVTDLGSRLTFEEWIKNANLSMHCTYIFELCTPINRIVVKYEDYKVWLIAIRNRDNDKEYDITKVGSNLHVPVCPTYRLGSLPEMIEFVSSHDPLKHEGIVVCDKNFNRVKIKNPGYLALSRAKDSAMRSPRALVELCLLGKLDDALPLLPASRVSLALKIKEGLRELIKNCNESYTLAFEEARLRVREELQKTGATSADEKLARKCMALAAKNQGAWMSYIMSRYQGQVQDFHEYMNKQVDPSTGEYKKTFLEALLSKLKL